MRYFLGIDQSTVCTGWCLLPVTNDNLTRELVGQFDHEFSPVTGTGQKLEDWWDRSQLLLALLDAFIIEHKHEIVAVGLEQPNVSRNLVTTRELCGISGIIQYWFRTVHDMYPNEIPTPTCKAAVGRGFWKKKQKRDKKGVVDIVNLRFGLDFIFTTSKAKSAPKSDDNKTDAVAVACALKEAMPDIVELEIKRLDTK